MTNPGNMAQFQLHISQWATEVFGPEIASHIGLRCYRFFEEATELVQALGMTKAQCVEIMEYVYERPVGEPSQEVGGTSVTLAALCAAASINWQDAAWAEQERVESPEIKEKIRRKQASKPSPFAVLPAQVRPLGFSNETAAVGAPPGMFENKTLVWSYPGQWKNLGKPAVEQHITMEDLEPQGGCMIGMPGCNCVNPGPQCPNWASTQTPAFHKNSTGSVAVSDSYAYNKDMTTCPRSVKLILLGAGGVATLGTYDGDPFWVGWAALPKDN